MKPAGQILDPDVRVLASRATEFVAGFRWCQQVTGCALAFAIAGVLGIFRIDLRPTAEADPVVWVVVGDLPSAYLAYEEGDGWQDALGGYVEEMQACVDAARAGASIEDLIPVNAPPTPEYVQMLASRLEFLRRNLLEVDPDSVEGDA